MLPPDQRTAAAVDAAVTELLASNARAVRAVDVAAEIAALPLVFGAWRTALAFTAADALVKRLSLYRLRRAIDEYRLAQDE